MPVRMWQELATTDFRRADAEQALVLLPLGATEQHGPHLPTGCDTYLVEEGLRRLTPRIADLDVVVLPALWCTKSNEHAGLAGSLYLRAETLMAVLHDMAEGIAAAGFRRLVLLNWHGGNIDLLSVMAREIRLRHQLLVFAIQLIDPAFMQMDTAHSADLHAGRLETGMLLAARPELVKPGPYADLASDIQHGPLAETFAGYRWLLPEGGPVRIGWHTSDLTTTGVIGNPEGANAAEGDRLLNEMAASVEAILREISTFTYRT